MTINHKNSITQFGLRLKDNFDNTLSSFKTLSKLLLWKVKYFCFLFALAVVIMEITLTVKKLELLDS